MIIMNLYKPTHIGRLTQVAFCCLLASSVQILSHYLYQEMLRDHILDCAHRLQNEILHSMAANITHQTVTAMHAYHISVIN